MLLSEVQNLNTRITRAPTEHDIILALFEDSIHVYYQSGYSTPLGFVDGNRSSKYERDLDSDCHHVAIWALYGPFYGFSLVFYDVVVPQNHVYDGHCTSTGIGIKPYEFPYRSVHESFVYVAHKHDLGSHLNFNLFLYRTVAQHEGVPCV